MSTYTNESFLESRSLRDNCIERLDILNRVKALFLIPEVNLMSTGMVAKFFDVPADTIRKEYQLNKDELDPDGVKAFSSKELQVAGNNFTLLPNGHSGVIVSATDGTKYNLPHTKTTYYTPRSVMRLAMLLRDSKVAREVRTQLLNVVMDTAPEKRIKHIEEEDALLLAIMKAETVESRAIAINEYAQYKNRHIEKMQATIDTLLNEARYMDFGKTMNSLIKAYAGRYKGPLYGANDEYHAAWNNLYYRLRSTHGIDVHRRAGRGSLLSKIKDSEQQMAVRMAAELAQSVGVDIVSLLGEMNATNYDLKKGA